MKTIKLILDRVLYPTKPYWTSSVYGFGKWIRRYGYYPPILPLCINTDHAPGEPAYADNFPESKSTAPFQLFHSPRRTVLWKKKFNKPAATLYSPFVFARKQMMIDKLPSAKGTIYFIAHTTEDISDDKKVETYINEANSMPEIYKPITICLHNHDVKKGIAERYTSAGFEVVSAGDPRCSEFTENFYKILQRHNFCVSNLMGSYALYAIEMNIPFGIYGMPPQYINHGDKNLPLGEHSKYEKEQYHSKGIKIFSGLPGVAVSDEQKKFAHYYLGLNDGLSRGSMAIVLYLTLIAWVILLPIILMLKVVGMARQ